MTQAHQPPALRRRVSRHGTPRGEIGARTNARSYAYERGGVREARRRNQHGQDQLNHKKEADADVRRSKRLGVRSGEVVMAGRLDAPQCDAALRL